MQLDYDGENYESENYEKNNIEISSAIHSVYFVLYLLPETNSDAIF